MKKHAIIKHLAKNVMKGACQQSIILKDPQKTWHSIFLSKGGDNNIVIRIHSFLKETLAVAS